MYFNVFLILLVIEEQVALIGRAYRCKGGLCFSGKGSCTRFDFGCLYSRVVPNATDFQLCRDHSTGFPEYHCHCTWKQDATCHRVAESENQIRYDIVSGIFFDEEKGKAIRRLLTRTALVW